MVLLFYTNLYQWLNDHEFTCTLTKTTGEITM